MKTGHEAPSSMSSSAIRVLRVFGLVEGVSFVVLLGIAMPLKYLAGMPRAVSVVGMAHGVLFVLYAAALVHAHFTVGWSMRRSLGLFAAAVIPLGPLLVDGGLRRDQREAASREMSSVGGGPMPAA
jgi:integral membrane protein